MAVVVDVHLGVALLDGVAVPVASAGAAGELAVGGDDGPVLRPVTFGERRHVVLAALAAVDARDALCARLRAVATVRAGTGVDPGVADVLALVLAGAGIAAPPLADAVAAVARATGWTWADLDGAPAAHVDLLAVDLGATGETAWTRIVLAPEAHNAGDDDRKLRRLRAALADELLSRAAPGGRAADSIAESAPQSPVRPVPDRSPRSGGDVARELVGTPAPPTPPTPAVSGAGPAPGPDSAPRWQPPLAAAAAAAAPTAPSRRTAEVTCGPGPTAPPVPGDTASLAAAGEDTERAVTTAWAADRAGSTTRGRHDLQGIVAAGAPWAGPGGRAAADARAPAPFTSGPVADIDVVRRRPASVHGRPAPAHRSRSQATPSVEVSTAGPPWPAVVPVPSPAVDADDVARSLATALHFEADLRGLDRA